MNISSSIKLVLVFFVHYGVSAQRSISKLECEKTSVFEVDERSAPLYLMDIVYINLNLLLCSATLISNQFMLSSESCASFIKSSPTELRVRKSKLISELYFDNHLFSIKRLITHSLDEIALIELNEVVPYDFKRSSFQPACLWTRQIVPSDYTVLVHRNIIFDEILNSTFYTNSGTLISERSCAELWPKWNDYIADDLRMCVNISQRTNFVGIGCTIFLKVNNRYYIVGIVNSYFIINDSTIIFATKISNFTSWIESNVWPISPDQVPEFICGQRKINRRPLISYGLPTYQGKFPWHVAIFRSEGDWQPYSIYICGGTIINDQTILTAAHCVMNVRTAYPPNRILVMAGTHDIETYLNGTQNYTVKLIIMHEEFDPTYMENDIAVLKLAERLIFSDFIQPICVRHNLDFDNNIITLGTVPGWGINELNQTSTILFEATFQIHNNSVCRKSDREFYHMFLNDGNFCAGHQNGTNACPGDSGGGMVIQYKLRWYIRGIVSTAAVLPNSEDCNLIHSVLFTDVQKFSKWIIFQSLYS